MGIHYCKGNAFLTIFWTVDLHIFKFSQESLAKLTVGFFRRYIFMWMKQGQNCYIQHTCVKLHFLRSLQKEFLCCSRLKYERAKSNLPVFLYPLFLEDLKALCLHWSPGLTWCLCQLLLQSCFYKQFVLFCTQLNALFCLVLAVVVCCSEIAIHCKSTCRSWKADFNMWNPKVLHWSFRTPAYFHRSHTHFAPKIRLIQLINVYQRTFKTRVFANICRNIHVCTFRENLDFNWAYMTYVNYMSQACILITP